MSIMTRKIVLAIALQASLVAAFAPVAEAAGRYAGRAEGTATSFLPGPDGVAITVVAQGLATQMGLFTREERILLDPASGTFTGSVVFTAANGDQLAGTLVGGFVSPGTATGSYAFDSGSGRFSNTVGNAEFVLSTPDGIHFTVTFEGSLEQ